MHRQRAWLVQQAHLQPLYDTPTFTGEASLQLLCMLL
jgi:hypothetical protein